MEQNTKRKGYRAHGPVVSKTVSMPVDRVNRICEFSEMLPPVEKLPVPPV